MAQQRQNVASAGGAHPHSVSLKVLRLSRPSLNASSQLPGDGLLTKASKPYPSAPNDPFALTPLLQLPPAFGAAYVGTTFSCTLCANNELSESSPVTLRNVEVTAELQTPGSTTPLELAGHDDDDALKTVKAGQTVQKVVRHDLREDGQHVLAVTVKYTEIHDDEDEGVKRTFRKLYQFIAQPAIGVRTKIGELKRSTPGARKFVLEAQLENLTEATVVVDTATLNLASGLGSTSLNQDAEWMVEKSAEGGKSVLIPQDVWQVAFVLEQKDGEDLEEKGRMILLAQVHVDWRGPMGEKGELTTGWLGCKSR